MKLPKSDAFITPQMRIEHLRYGIEILKRMYLNAGLRKICNEALSYRDFSTTLDDIPELENITMRELIGDKEIE